VGRERTRPSFHRLHLRCIHGDALNRYDVVEVCHRGFAKEALGEEMTSVQLMQHGAHMLKVFCPGRTEDQNIIKKHKHKAANVRLQNIIHECLKRGRGVGEAKRHDKELKMATVHPEHCLGDNILGMRT